MTEYRSFFDVELKQRPLSEATNFGFSSSIDKSKIPDEGVLLEFGKREYYNDDPILTEHKFDELIKIIEGFSKVHVKYYAKHNPSLVFLEHANWASKNDRNTQIKMKLLGIEPNRIFWFRNDLNDT